MSYKRLTTIDNPWDPDTHYDQWFAYNRDFYNVDCDAIVERVVRIGSGLSEEEIESAYDLAFEEIMKNNILGIFKVIEKDAPEPARDLMMS